MANHLPVLLVVVPLLTAPVCLLLRSVVLVRILATFASWVCFAVACALFADALDGRVISYAFGGWAAPWGIEYRLDAANACVIRHTM